MEDMEGNAWGEGKVRFRCSHWWNLFTHPAFILYAVLLPVRVWPGETEIGKRFEARIRYAPEHSDLNLLAVLKLVKEGGERKQNEFAYSSEVTQLDTWFGGGMETRRL